MSPTYSGKYEIPSISVAADHLLGDQQRQQSAAPGTEVAHYRGRSRKPAAADDNSLPPPVVALVPVNRQAGTYPEPIIRERRREEFAGGVKKSLSTREPDGRRNSYLLMLSIFKLFELNTIN